MTFGAILMVLVFGQLAFAQDVGEIPARVLSTVPFVTPKVVDEAGIDGTLRVSVKIDKTGKVTDLSVIGGPSWPCNTNPKREIEVLKDAVRENLLLAKFQPSTKNDKPRSSEMVVKFAIGETYQAELRRREREDAERKGIAPPIYVKAGVLNGRALSLPKPAWPDAAKSMMSNEPVIVEIKTDEDGRVVRAGALSGEPVLQYSSRTAACEAKFLPTYVNGQAVRVTGTITYMFGSK